MNFSTFSEIISPWLSVINKDKYMYYNENLKVFSDELPQDILIKVENYFLSIIQPWVRYYDSQTNRNFYYNCDINKSLWELPPELKAKEEYFWESFYSGKNMDDPNEGKNILLEALSDCWDIKRCNSLQNSASQAGIAFESSVRVIFNQSLILKQSDFGNKLKINNNNQDFSEIDGIFDVLNKDIDLKTLFGNKIEPWKFEYLNDQAEKDKNCKKIILLEVKCTPLLKNVLEFLQKVPFYCRKLKEANPKQNFSFMFCYVYNSKDTNEFNQELENNKPVFKSKMEEINQFVKSSLTLFCIHVLQDEGLKTMEEMLKQERAAKEQERAAKEQERAAKEQERINGIKLHIKTLEKYGIRDNETILKDLLENGYQISIKELQQIKNSLNIIIYKKE